MIILVIYYNAHQRTRKTIVDHLYSFSRYDKKNRYIYFNAIWGVPGYISEINFDMIFFHYTVLSMRFHENVWRFLCPSLIKKISPLNSFKVAFPQDEYCRAGDLCQFFKNVKIDLIFTCAKPEDYRKFYPEELSGVKHIVSTYTGFVDEVTLKIINSKEFNLKTNSERSIDIGYRARDLPFCLGRHGQLKVLLSKVFLEKKIFYPSLKFDISTKDSDVFTEFEWIQFLCHCRVVLGCLGGASLLDFDGSILKKTEKYKKDNPTAEFAEVERECFPGLDGNISLFAISPRHFECAMTRTCQVLIEGDYMGIFRPNIDFIELKKDFSNLKEVFDLIKNREYCSRIAENCYERVILSGDYTYDGFVDQVLKKTSFFTKKSGVVSCKSKILVLALVVSEKFSLFKKNIFRIAVVSRRFFINLRLYNFFIGDD